MAYRPVFVLGAVMALSISSWTQQAPLSDNAPLSVPLTMTETGAHTFKPMLSVGIGSLPPLPITLDTGSVGLVVFDVPGIPGNGITCNSDDSFSVSFGNPLRVTYSGMICNGPISLAGVISTPSIRFGLLTTLTYCASTCKTPHDNYLAGNYGVFGAGIAPGLELPNPLRTLPGAQGRRFMLRLNADTTVPSSLILAPHWRFDAAVFPQGEQTVGARNRRTYDKGQGCVLVTPQPASVCPLVSFDTGNGVPWFHATIPGLPTTTEKTGTGDTITFVVPGTIIGVAPRLGGLPAFTLVAGDIPDEFRVEDLTSNLINVSIQAFLGNDVIYDGEQGVITVAPTKAPE